MHQSLIQVQETFFDLLYMNDLLINPTICNNTSITQLPLLLHGVTLI